MVFSLPGMARGIGSWSKDLTTKCGKHKLGLYANLETLSVALTLNMLIEVISWL